jgi:uncharacterized protein YbjQ (UPF0145 family)
MSDVSVIGEDGEPWIDEQQFLKRFNLAKIFIPSNLGKDNIPLPNIDDIIVTSGFNIDGYHITKYVDYISAEVVLGMGLFKGIAASFSDFFGTESNSLTRKLQEARKFAKDRLLSQAHDLGCNAIIGIDIDVTMFGESLVGIICNGTAVCIELNNNHVLESDIHSDK